MNTLPYVARKPQEPVERYDKLLLVALPPIAAIVATRVLMLLVQELGTKKVIPAAPTWCNIVISIGLFIVTYPLFRTAWRKTDSQITRYEQQRAEYEKACAIYKNDLARFTEALRRRRHRVIRTEEISVHTPNIQIIVDADRQKPPRYCTPPTEATFIDITFATDQEDVILTHRVSAANVVRGQLSLPFVQFTNAVVSEREDGEIVAYLGNFASFYNE